MGFLLALLGLVVAGDVLELEPVQDDGSNNYGCNRWSPSNGNSKTRCDDSPYCRWGAISGGYKCYDDPCLKLMSDTDTCTNANIGTENINCHTISLSPKITDADCGDNQTVVDVCVQNDPPKSSDLYNYCLYAQLRDSKCPATVCREFAIDAPDTTLEKHCNINSPVAAPTATGSGCNHLSTSTECGLVPKCYWKSGNCIKDPCFVQEEQIPDSSAGKTCATYVPETGVKCKEVKMFKKNGGGSVTTYCVHTDNSKPNLCYLGNPGIGADSSDDYLETYPTLVIDTDGDLIDKPTCSATAASCDNMGETCSVKLNKQGGLAGAYCGDEGHGAANILRIPSLLVVLLIALFSIFN